MTQIYPRVRSMSFAEQVEYGLCNRGLMMDQGERSYLLTAGTTDSLHVFQQGSVLYVLTLNSSLDYVALDWYQGTCEESVDGVFLQGDYAISECAGNDWRNLSVDQLAERLIWLFQ